MPSEINENSRFKSLKTVFMGTPYEVLPVLNRIYELTDLISIFTAPDKQGCRGKKLIVPAVKNFALEKNITYHQPCSWRDTDAVDILKSYEPDIVFVMSYGYILPKEVLEIPTNGAYNLHASLLPKYRGASPLQHALLNNDRITGITLQKMSEKLDQGDIISTKSTDIEPDDDYLSLKEKICELAPNLLEETLTKLSTTPVEGIKQNESMASICRKITKESGKIHWDNSATNIWCMVRAYTGWPTAYSYLNGKRIIIHKASVYNDEDKSEGLYDRFQAGTIVEVSKNNLLVKCGSGILKINYLQLENKSVMDYKCYINGYRPKLGDRFDS